MGVHGRKRFPLGPLVINAASTGWLRWRITSVTVRLGPWSWNSRADRQRVDLPGPWSWTGRRRNR
ncbi:hypothetical protein Ae406Ps2_6353c [Pseudonocardia sp. Ae406_Ps2]|nr:hypothetical protein Ae331Ps2_6276c [Pseudonocardia sp. Ae331_Ps2]OLL89913.1 hypothetical protein Ae406Ps2_6353c [Pseudonocardia sp. Ae406_Ps2]